MKKHDIIEISRPFLEQLDACQNGLDAIADLLPATISTDPEDNIELALEIVARPMVPHSVLSAGYHVGWLASKAPVDWVYYDLNDPYSIAQILAMIADHLLTKAGR